MTARDERAAAAGLPRPPGLFRRYWARHPLVFDAILAGCWMALAVLVPVLAPPAPEAELGRQDASTVVIWIAGVALAGAALLARRSWPMLAFVGVLVGTLPASQIEPTSAVLGLGIAVYSVAVYSSNARGWLAFGLAAAMTVLLALVQLGLAVPPWSVPGTSRAEVAVTLGIGYGQVLLLSVLLGINVGARRRYVAALVDHAERLERDSDQQAQLAALGERSRIARDVHDIVAHSLSVIVRLADGAEAVFEKNPERARDAVAQVGEVARSSLTEMRRVIGVLESDAASPRFSSQAGFDDIPELIEVYRKVGLPVRLTLVGDPPTEAGVQLAVFRVVQEALTNALRYAVQPSAVTVTIESARDVEVEVVNDGLVGDGELAEGAHVGGPHGSGRGILGMRERAALYGGTVQCGPTGDGSWRVRMRLPGQGGGRRGE